MNNGDKTTRIVMADDHPMFRAGLRSMLESNPHLTIVGEASDGSEAVSLVRQTMPDVLLLDLAMPSLSGFEVLRELSDVHNSVKCIVLTANISKNEVVYALQLGARGVLWKNSAANLLVKSIECVLNQQIWISREIVGDVVDTLRAVPIFHPNSSTGAAPELVRVQTGFAGIREPESGAINNGRGRKFGLTPREIEIVTAIVDGQSNRDIAKTYGISEYTVKHHLTRIFDKVGVYSRLELAVFAMHHNLSRPVDEMSLNP